MSDSLLHGLPGWITAETIADTRTTFELAYGRPLTDGEVIEILLTTGQLFAILDGSE